MATHLKNLSAPSPGASTLVELLRLRALQQPEQLAYTFLAGEARPEVSLTYGELDERARALGHLLQDRGLAGQRALLLYAPGLDFVAAFFGCLYAGVIAIPAYPPRLNRNLIRLEAIAIDAQAKLALTTNHLLPKVASLLEQIPGPISVQCLATDIVDTHAAAAWCEPVIDPHSVAYLQYTSGSTASPKGVMVSHANVLHNSAYIKHGFEHTTESLSLTWLPHFHDMGLVDGIIQPLYTGFHSFLMSPTSFLQKPFRWLDAISRYKVTHSGGPNFAYDLCVRKISAEQRATLDLRSWSVAYNGAEPVRQQTLQQFTDAFQPYGFRPRTFYPAYGLAEATLKVSGGLKNDPPVCLKVQRAALKENRVIESPKGESESTVLVSSGRAMLDTKIVIVNPQSLTECLPEEVGEIWVSGPGVAPGYWNRPEETTRTFGAHLSGGRQGPFLRTGDLGFLKEGELFVTGRIKDLIIVRGRNHYPQDIELTVENSQAARRPSACAAFSIELQDQERLVIVSEVERHSRAGMEMEETIQAIRQAVADCHELDTFAVVLVKPGNIPRTSSGKMARLACRDLFLTGGLDVLAQWQKHETLESENDDSISIDASSSPTDIQLWIRSRLAAILRTDPSQLNINAPMTQYGLDSLAAIELMHRMETTLGVVLPMASWLDNLSITELADQTFAQLTGRSFLPGTDAGPNHDISCTTALARGQQALWFLHQMAPESAAYNISHALRLNQAIDVTRLQRSFQSLVDRHPCLRTTFPAIAGEPIQQVHDRAEVCFRYEEATAWTDADLNERLTQEAHAAFDLEQGPLLRVSLFRRTSHEYVLSLSVHHIIADFWSLAVIVNELGIIYEADGSSAPLPPLSLDFNDYVRWQESMLAGAEGDRLWRYWKEQLSGELPVLNLPTDRPRPPVQTYRGASQFFTIDRELTEQLKQLSQRRGCTIYTTLLAAFHVFLHRYTGQENMIIGSPTAGRDWAELTGLVGYFVNPIALRAGLWGNPRFEAFLLQMRRTVVSALEHQAYPFALLVKRLQPERDASRSPLFQAMFALQKTHLPDQEALAAFMLVPRLQIRLGGLVAESLNVEQRIAQFDLQLMSAEVNQALAASFEYNTDLFDAETIARMSENFQALLQSIVANPGWRISDLPLLADKQRQQLLVEWNDTYKEIPRPGCFQDLFKAQAERTPEATAVMFEGETLTYAELNRRAGHLAMILIRQGVRPEAVVSLLSERGINLLTAILAIFKAGGVYLPLDPSHPAPRLQQVLTQSGSRLVLVAKPFQSQLSEALRGAFAQDPPRLLPLDALLEQAIAINEAEPEYPSRCLPSNLAYVIYTSGSTGVPKGAMVEHQGMLNHLYAKIRDLQITGSDIVVQNASPCFDISVWQMLAPLLVGGCTYIVGDETAHDPTRLLDEVETHAVSILEVVPSLLRLMLDQPADLKATPHRLSALRWLIVTGEALPPGLCDEWLNTYAAVPLMNAYGPTECSDDVTHYVARSEHSTGLASVPIGHPINNIRLYVFDRFLSPVPAGVFGELYVGGTGVGRGYLNDPVRTANQFPPNPFGSEPGTRLYKTGDLCRYLSDGNLEFLGRLDHQVKVRGFRIELEEIEAVLGQHDHIEQAIVVARADVAGEKRLVAYVVFNQPHSESADELRAFLRQRLPDYMSPSSFVILDKLPLTRNGKVDRRALPLPDQTHTDREVGFAAPRDQTEKSLSEVWQKVLHLERVGIHDNFFDLGGDSILSIQVVARARQEGIELSARDVLEHPTIAELSQIVSLTTGIQEQQESITDDVPLTPTQRRFIEDHYPLSPTQQGLLFHSLYEPSAALYTTQIICRLRGHLDGAAFAAAWQQVVERHEVLRCGFVWEGVAEPLAVVRREASVEIRQEDWRQKSESEQEAAEQEYLHEERARGWELREGGLMRVAVMRLGEAEYEVVWSCHHLILDGWSMPIVLQEVLALYDSYRAGQVCHLDKPRPFKDAIMWLRRQDLSEAERFWREMLKGFATPTPLGLSNTHLNPEAEEGCYDEQHLYLSQETTAALQSVARQHRLTLNTLVQGAWALLLSRYSGERDIVFGFTSSGRPPTLPGSESIVGTLINTLPIRVRVPPEQSLLSWLNAFQSQLLAILKYEYTPLARIQEWSDVQRGVALFETLFVFENYPLDSALLKRGREFEIVNVRSIERTNYALTVAAALGPPLVLHLGYDTRRFARATITRMLERLQSVLTDISTNLDRRLCELSLLTESERRLLEEGNHTRVDFANAHCIHELFEKQVGRSPDAMALTFGQEQLTYHELNQRANQLAHHLLALGIKPEQSVGICMVRSVEMIVGLLAILKAGGAYLPLDPQYPKPRLAYMIEDARSRFVLAQQRLLERLPAQRPDAVCLDRDWELISQRSEQNPPAQAAPDNLAYVIYTSGSTGKPKGVMISHRAASNHLQWAAREFPLDHSDRVLQKYSIMFDASVLEIFYPLISGASLVIAKPGGQGDADYLVESMQQGQVTAIDLVPSMLNALMADKQIEGCTGLRRVTCGGEALSGDLVERVYERLGEVELANLYGPTEATIGATYHRCQRGMAQMNVPIGLPIANTQVYLLDEAMSLTATGIVGEIYIGGEGLARGYLNQADLTAERFLPSPFGEEEGPRLYRTGDLGRHLANGSLEFLSRKDDQVKIYGFRVETREIEERLKQHPAIKQAVVVQTQVGASKRLAAYLVCEGANEVGAGELRKFLKEELPDYMVPAAFVRLKQLPLTRSGKVDKQALPLPDGLRPETERDRLAPRNTIEKALASVWSEALGLEEVGVDDNFFELGGDSIISMQVVAKARRSGLALTPKQLFENPTIAALSQMAGEAKAEWSEQETVAGPVPLTPIQRWFFEQNIANPNHFNQAILIEVKHDLAPTILEKALDHLIRHHDGLRLRFTNQAGRWLQVNAAVENNRSFALIDLSQLDERGQAISIEAVARQTQVSLNLEQGPIIRAVYFSLGANESPRMLIVAHHLAIDGVSWRVLLDDLQLACQQLRHGAEINFPRKTSSFKRWAELLIEHAQTDTVNRELDHWTAEARNHVTRLPVDYTDGVNTSASARNLWVSLSAEETQALLHDLPAAYRTQVNDVLITALAQVFAEWMGDGRLLVDLEGHGREEVIEGVNLSRTIGWFTSVFPVVIKLDAAHSEGDALRSVSKQLRSIPNRGIGYGLLRYLSKVPNVAARLEELPQAEVSFNYLGQLDQVLDESSYFVLATGSVGPTQDRLSARSYKIEIEARVLRGQLQVEWTYSEQLHSRPTIEYLATEFINHIRSIIRGCVQSGEIKYLPADFAGAQPSDEKLQQLAASGPPIEDHYPLSPTQQGLLFHSLYEPSAALYTTQIICRLRGHLDGAAFAAAWQQVAARHEVLRCGFVWEGVAEPLAVVRREASVQIRQEDWRQKSGSEQEAAEQEYLHEERARGWELREGGLMRVAVMRLGEAEYEVVWSCHHLILDGWSMPIVLKQVLRHYEAIKTGKEIRKERERPYRGYIEWLNRQDLKKAEEYWRAQLRGISRPTQLTIGRAGEAGKACNDGYEEQEWKVDEATTEKLKAVGRKHHLTMSTMMEAAWGFLLSRYGNEQVIIYGKVFSGRSAELDGIDTMVGLFINTLPAIAKIGFEAKLMDWMKELQGRHAEMQQFEWTPLVRIQEWSEINRGSPLFESLFVFENYPIDESVKSWLTGYGSDLEVSRILSIERTNYPLALTVTPGQQLSLNIAYDLSRFDRQTISGMLRHMARLLEAIASDPHRHISEWPILSEEEAEQVLFEWNATFADYPRDKCIQELFEAQVAHAPDAPAVEFNDSLLTYRELNRRANRLAHYLRSLGISVESRVGICMEPGADMIIGLLAILKAGGAYVPLDPSYPTERLAGMAQDSQLAVLLTQQKLAARLPENLSLPICLDRDWGRMASQNDQNPINWSDSDNLAYVMYTSGSTGEPKGVCVTHKAVSRLVLNSNYIRLTASDRMGQVSNSSFDAATFEIWGALLNGACLVCVDRAVGLSPQDLTRQVSERRLSTLFLTTALFNQMASEAPGWCRSMQNLLVGGEAVGPRWVREVIVNGAPERLINGYGPTEATTFATWHLMQDAEEAMTTIPIGRPISNTQIYLLDEMLQPVPIGAPAQIYIGGDGLARCYLHQPALTAEKFTPAPFSKEPGRRLYKTGDLGRHRADGSTEFVGRVDHQIKIRGFRVEPGEIETVLKKEPAVKDAVVLAREDTPGDKRLVAYVVFAQEQAATFARLRDRLKAKLPDYMLPSAFVALDELPLTPNGKVDRQALPAPPNVRPELETSFAAALTPTQEMLCEIWAQVLGIDRVGVYDNFFELGGHSLLVTQTVSRIRHLFKVDLPLRSLFQSPTVASLSETLEAVMRQEARLQAPVIEPVLRTQRSPLSFAQQRLWSLCQIEPISIAYNIPAVFHLKGALDVAALEQSLNEIVRRHEVLRTRFPILDSGPWQVIASDPSFILPLADLSHLSQTERDAETLRLVDEEAHRQFDLAQGPLLRVRLLRLADDEHVLLLTVHHIVMDGWSVQVFGRELHVLYETFSKGESSPLPPLRVQYADFSDWQRQWLKGDVLKSLLSYWKQQLGSELPLMSLPADHSRPVVQSFSGATISAAISKELAAAIKALSFRQQTTLFMTQLAAFKTLLYRYSGQEDILVGTPIANRSLRETEGLIGFFVNTLVLRTDLSGNPTFRELLNRIREVALEAYAHQDLPLEILVDELQPRRSLHHTPLFQVMFVHNSDPVASMELPGLTLHPVEVQSRTAKFDLTLLIEEKAQSLVASLEYNLDLFEAATIERMLGHLNQLLEGIAADPDKRLADLPLLTEAERQELIEWSRPRAAFLSFTPIHERFEQQAQLRPDAIAIVCQQQQLSFAVLNSAANRLAHFLLRRGAQPDSLIALCLDRSVEMIVAILAVLKAGAAYLPLDPALPPARRRFMLDDSAAPLLLTTTAYAGDFSSSAARLLTLESFLDKRRSQPGTNPAVPLHPSHLAYVIYTSGSTGAPKAALLEHRNLARLFDASDPLFAFNERDTWSLFHSYGFDFSVWEMFGALCYGGKLVLVSEAERRDPQSHYELLAREAVTVLNQTPTAFKQLMQVDRQRQASLALRVVIFGGEALELDALRPWIERHGDAQPQLVNMYGITETCVHVTYRRIRAADVEARAGSLIGTALADLTLQILDEHGQQLPVGVCGELYISGSGLGRGYLRQPEQTATRFVPGSRQAGERLYRSGDVGRWLASGEVEYLGRGDRQVKVRGYRIELAEIEATLIQHTDVLDSKVIVREEGGDNKRLVAYVIWNKDALCSVSQLRDHLKEKLPYYMIPAAFVVLEKFPLTANGKLDRLALPEPEGTPSELGTNFVEPESAMERTIAAVWREILSVRKIGANDNFFDLGGNSLLMAVARNQLADALKKDILMIDLFTFTTVSALARHLTGLTIEAPPPQLNESQVETRRESRSRRNQFRKEQRIRIDSQNTGPKA